VKIENQAIRVAAAGRAPGRGGNVQAGERCLRLSGADGQWEEIEIEWNGHLLEKLSSIGFYSQPINKHYTGKMPCG
jgi:hypothetical protein